MRGSIAGLGLQAAADGLLAAKQALQGSEAQLEAALAAAQAYVAAYPSGGGPAAEWAGLVAALQAAASAASAAVGQAPADASWADQVSGGSQGHVNTEVPSAWAALMTCVGVP